MIAHPASIREKVLLLVATGTLLGLSTNLSKIAHGAGLSPLSYLFWSVLGAAILLAFQSVRAGSFPRMSTRVGEYFIAAAVLTIAAPNLLFFSAVPNVGVSFVALAIAFPPLLTYLGALVLGMERFNALRASGVAIALAGAFWIAWLKLATPQASTMWIVATLVGPVVLAAGNIYRTVRWPPNATGDGLAPGMLVAAAALLFMASFWPGASLHVPIDTWTALLVITAQVVTFALQFLVYFKLQQKAGPVYLSLIGAVGAVTGVPFAIALLGDVAPEGLLLGGALIAVGIVLLTIAAARPAALQGRNAS